jgi:hypothetical protein
LASNSASHLDGPQPGPHRRSSGGFFPAMSPSSPIVSPLLSSSSSSSSSKIWAWISNDRRHFFPSQSRARSFLSAGNNLRGRGRARARTDRHGAAGYLLLEVLLALVVLSIIVGLVFRIIQTTSSVTSNVQFLQSQQEHSDGIYELLRKDIESLPLNAGFQTKRTKDEFQLIFDETSFNFSWKGNQSGFGTVILAAQRQADGRFSNKSGYTSSSADSHKLDIRSSAMRLALFRSSCREMGHRLDEFCKQTVPVRMHVSS